MLFSAWSPTIRTTGPEPIEPPIARPSRLADAQANAVVLGDHDQAVKILDGAIRRHADAATAADRIAALEYRPELALRLTTTSQPTSNPGGRGRFRTADRPGVNRVLSR